jgi:hypothetical protein
MAGENDTALIKSLFRVVYRDQYAISKSVNSLMTSFENYMNVSLPVLRLFNLIYPSDEAAVASFVLNNPLLIDSSESQPLSKSLFLIYNERSSCLGQGCKFSIEFSHQPVKYSSSKIETSLQPVRCYSNEYKNHSFDCGNGYNFAVECVRAGPTRSALEVQAQSFYDPCLYTIILRRHWSCLYNILHV